jgi:peptidylprolyl isomerase
MKMSLQKTDFILIEYVAKEHLYKEGDIVEPKLVVIGENWVLKPLDESLTTMEIGKPTVVEITPEKAFGQRDPEKVKRVPLKQLLARDITPSVGLRIEYGGKNATVRAIGAGRVLLDYNPPLAGKTLVYEVTVKRKLDTVEEKITALIHRRIPHIEDKKFEFTSKTKTVTIEMPEDAFYLEGVQIAKRGIAMDIQRFFPETTNVKFVETFKTEPKKTETKPEEQEKQAEGTQPST